MKRLTRRRRNPYVGKPQPDLFEGESRVYKRVDELDEDEMRDMARDDFTDDEWEEVPDDVQEWIYKNDPDSQSRIEALVNLFVNQFLWATQPEYIDSGDYEHDHDYFWGEYSKDEMLRAFNNNVGDWFSSLYEEMEALGLSTEQVDDMLAGEEGILRDYSNYDIDVDGYADGVYSPEIIKSIYIEGSEIEPLVEDMHPDEIDIAIERIKSDTDSVVCLDTRDLYNKRSYRWWDYEQNDIDTGYYANLIPDRDRIESALREATEGMEVVPSEPASPPEERVVKRFADGFYVQDLDAAELPEEGKRMGLCVGDPGMGYISAVLRKETKIWSLRTPAGKPKLTIELEINSRGEPIAIHQVKGRGNRIAGYPAGGGKFKPDEVAKLIDVFGEHGFTVEDLKAVSDMRRAIQEMYDTPGSRHYVGPGSERENPGSWSFDMPWAPYDER